MEQSRATGTAVFFLVGFVFTVMGVVLAGRYQSWALSNLLDARTKDKHIRNRLKEEMINRFSRLHTPQTEAALLRNEKNLRRNFVDVQHNLARVERECREIWFPRRNYAMLISVIGFALMGWGLFRLLQD